MKILVSPSVILMGSVFLLSGNIEKALIPVLAAVIHEIGHLTFAFLFSIPINRIELNLFGAIIETPPLACSYKQEVIFAAAGPLANLISAATVGCTVFYFPSIKNNSTILFIAASLIFACINLLPASSFDGGRILKCILLLKFSPNAAISILEWLSLLCIFILWSISVYFIVRTGSYLSLFVFSGALFSKIFLFKA